MNNWVLIMQGSFSELKYRAKKKQTKRDIFLSQRNEVSPWPEIVSRLEPFYPKGKGLGRPPIGLEKMLRMYVTLSMRTWAGRGF